METKFQTSFIPKQPVTSDAPHHASATSLFFLFGFIIFMASIAAAGGVFIYGQIVKKNIDNGTSQLTLNRNAFDPNTINEITRLNDRINAATYLLQNHKSVSTLFLVLGNATLKNVRFNDFNYTGVGDKISLTMKGQATSYETVALQAKAFTDPSLKNVFRSPLFGDLTLDTLGNVSFSFSTGIDPLLVDYYKLKKEEYANGTADGTSPDTGATVGGSTLQGQSTGQPINQNSPINSPSSAGGAGAGSVNPGNSTNPNQGFIQTSPNTSGNTGANNTGTNATGNTTGPAVDTTNQNNPTQ
jgi:hypothetical protein